MAVNGTAVAALDRGPLGLNGRDIAEAAKATLALGQEIANHWAELRPIVQELTRAVRIEVEGNGITELTATQKTNLLATCANVVDKMAKAGQSMLKAAEGQTRIAVLLAGGPPTRPDAKTMSEKQLAGVVLEAAKRMWLEGGKCPVCAGAQIVEAKPA